MKRVPGVKSNVGKYAGMAGQAAFVIGLSATGAVFFSPAEAAEPAAADRATAERAIPRQIEKTLRIPTRDVRRVRGGIEFDSRDYAEALSMDRQAVVRGLQTLIPGLKGDQIKVRGNRIFIGNDGEPPALKIENLCLVIKLNLCGKS